MIIFLKLTALIYLLPTLMSILSGLITFIYRKDRTRIYNSWKILKGNFYTNENHGVFKKAVQLISRFTWELLQTTTGYVFSQLRNTLGYVHSVNSIYGVTYVISENQKKRWGVSIGNHINISLWDKISTGFNARFYSDTLFIHEIGHTVDSRLFGPAYLLAIGIPSVISITTATRHLTESSTHDFFWTEKRADRHAEKLVSGGLRRENKKVSNC